MREKRSTVSVYIRSSLMEGVRENRLPGGRVAQRRFRLFFWGQVLQALEMGRAEIVLGERENRTRLTLQKAGAYKKKTPRPG